jgi:uncharacterized protein
MTNEIIGQFVYSGAALFLAGIVKGATGLGLPLVSLPVLLLFVSPSFAVIILAMCTIFANGSLVWYHRYDLAHDRPLLFAMFGMAIGAGAGSFFLAWADKDLIGKLLGSLMIVFVLLRLWQSSAWLKNGYSPRFGLMVGLLGGIVQGGVGAGAPVVAVFAQALGLAQARYVLCVSALYLSGAVVQVPALLLAANIPVYLMVISFIALVPVMSGVMVGMRLGRVLGNKLFTIVILVVMAISGVVLVVS